jgi:5'-nucleotidase
MTKEKPIIAMDVDDICAQLMVEWLARYNKDYGDNLKIKDITDWDISRFVKPECGNRIFRYLQDPSLYDNVKPTEGAVEGVAELRKLGYRIFFVTSSPLETPNRKYYWLKDNGFKPVEKDYVELRDKSVLLMDYMFDDRYDNAANFSGTAFLLTRPWNKKYYYGNRVSNWKEFLDKIKGESIW